MYFSGGEGLELYGDGDGQIVPLYLHNSVYIWFDRYISECTFHTRPEGTAVQARL